MSDKVLADIICRALIAIVVGIRKRYGLPDYHGISISLVTHDDIIENITTPATLEASGGMTKT